MRRRQFTALRRPWRRTGPAPGLRSTLGAALLILPVSLTTSMGRAAEEPRPGSASVEVPGTRSRGNVDGVLTWELGHLEPGQSAERTVLFLHARDLDAARRLRRQAVEKLAGAVAWPAPPAGAAAAGRAPRDTLWIENDTTDFALQSDGGFYWEEGRRQSLRGGHGGQLSRIGYSIRYRRDGDGGRFGVRIRGAPRRERLAILRPTTRRPGGLLDTLVASATGELELRIRSGLAGGAVAWQRYRITNRSETAVEGLSLSVHSNLEAAHDHGNDIAFLAPDLGVAAYDPQRKVLCLMAPVEPPSSGHVGTWPSEDALVRGDGPSLADWPPPPDLENYRPPLATIANFAPGAPRVEPEEPATRTRTSREARELLVRDWLFQAGGEPLAERARKEIRWTRKLAARIEEGGGVLPGGVREELARLEGELRRVGDAAPPGERARELYLAVRRIKRRIHFAHGAIDFTGLLFIDQPHPAGREWQHQARHRNGFMAVPGGRLLVLEGLWPGGELRKLGGLPPGAYWRPDLSFDATRVVFCYKAHDEESFHLWEIGIDGSGLRRLTAGRDDDLDPIYLPDGGLAFVTTRGKTYVRCMPYTRSNVLARCDGDGSNIRLISVNSEPDWQPALLPDGRILFSRWEYTDKALWRIQSLWTVHPDGTQLSVFWGNQSVWPDHPTEARPIPGTGRIIFTGTAHHDYFAGSIGIIDNGIGLNYPHGLTRVTWDVGWPEAGNGPGEKPENPDYHRAGKFTAYKSPFPLGEEDFLVSARAGNGRWKIYLMDTSGNRELIHEGVHNSWYPIPIRPVRKPPAIPHRVEWPRPGETARAPGHFFSSNVLEGVEGIPPQRVRYLRILRSDYKTYTLWRRDYRFEGPSVSIVQADSVKQILGTVPVERDGSVFFAAPSGVPLHFQLLDAEYRALHTMRSFTGLMPGETRGCVGCHEGHPSSPPNRTALATRRPPSLITPPPWGDATIGYERLVQPVLDRHCGGCHQGDGEGRSALDLTLRPGEGIFKEPYVTLIRSGIAGVIPVEGYDQRDPVAYRTYPPLEKLSARSRLIDLASSGRHYDVRVTGTELRQLIGWVDAMGPYRGREEIEKLDDPRCADAPIVARP